MSYLAADHFYTKENIKHLCLLSLLCSPLPCPRGSLLPFSLPARGGQSLLAFRLPELIILLLLAQGLCFAPLSACLTYFFCHPLACLASLYNLCSAHLLLSQRFCSSPVWPASLPFPPPDYTGFFFSACLAFLPCFCLRPLVCLPLT